MIYFGFKISNPFFTPTNEFFNKDYYWRDIKLSENKNFEIQISKFEPRQLLDFSVDLNWTGTDHAGPSLEIEVFGYMFNVKIYDSRHWNYDEHRWQTEEELKADMEEWMNEEIKNKGA